MIAPALNVATVSNEIVDVGNIYPMSVLHVVTVRRMVSASGTMSPTKEGELSARGEASDSEREPRVEAYI